MISKDTFRKEKSLYVSDSEIIRPIIIKFLISAGYCDESRESNKSAPPSFTSSICGESNAGSEVEPLSENLRNCLSGL
jgi:hypothetical protein